MKLAEVLRTECVHVGSAANDKALALCEIAALAKRSLLCRNVTEEAILDALQDRETLGATALGHGVAIPHCRLKGLHDFVVGLMTIPDGVDFEAGDGVAVRLLIFIIAPYEQSNAHIRLLSALSLRPALVLGQGASPWQPPPPFAKPETATDEGGLWALMDREEAKLKRSSFLIRDKALQQYVSGIACRLAGDHCPGVRVYLVRTPVFNANMAPNGMMQVWSGLLLRMGNEAQLAAVLGHEIGHYLARHMIDHAGIGYVDKILRLQACRRQTGNTAYVNPSKLRF